MSNDHLATLRSLSAKLLQHPLSTRLRSDQNMQTVNDILQLKTTDDILTALMDAQVRERVLRGTSKFVQEVQSWDPQMLDDSDVASGLLVGSTFTPTADDAPYVQMLLASQDESAKTDLAVDKQLLLRLVQLLLFKLIATYYTVAAVLQESDPAQMRQVIKDMKSMIVNQTMETFARLGVYTGGNCA
jgi:hypothetical protein